MYSITQYSEMIADGGRMDAYARALQHAIKPGHVVLDIGTGTGVAAVLSARFGARRVYAVEPSDAVFVAQEIAAANGVADRITFIQDISTAITLPERADVVVSDLRGVLPVFGQHLVAVADARARHLAPSGAMIPASDALWVSVAAAPELYASITSDWGRAAHGLDLRPARRLAVNSVCKVKSQPVDLLAPPVLAGVLDYSAIESPQFRSTTRIAAERRGLAHGLCVWFDCVLIDDIGFSNAPDHPPLVYGQAFFPWPEPVPMLAGDQVAVTLAADLVGESYIWQWQTQVMGKSGVTRDFRQSEIQGEMLSPATLRRRSAVHVPQLSEDGRIDALILELMDGRMALGDIAREVARRHPARFPRWEDALGRVGDLSLRYGG